MKCAVRNAAMWSVIGFLSAAGCEQASRPYIDPSEMAGRQTAAPMNYVPPRSAAAETAKVLRDSPAKAPLEVATPASDSSASQATVSRIVIYSATLELLVGNIAGAQEQIVAFANTSGGYMQAQSEKQLTVRVPAAKFDDTVARIGRVGEITGKNVTASDVTEEMTDLQIRLDTAEKTRDRLLELLKASNKTEDTLKIEIELQRLTETIEGVKGKKRYLESQIAMSTISVTFNSPARQTGEADKVPFVWVRELGDGVVTGRLEDRTREGSWWDRGIRFDLPKTYVRYFVEDDRTEALGANDLKLKVRKHKNFDEGALAFWEELAKKALLTGRTLTLDEQKPFTLASGASAVLFSGSWKEAGEAQGYFLVLAANKDDIITFEAWGPQASFAKERPTLEAAAKSIKMRK